MTSGPSHLVCVRRHSLRPDFGKALTAYIWQKRQLHSTPYGAAEGNDKRAQRLDHTVFIIGDLPTTARLPPYNGG